MSNSTVPEREYLQNAAKRKGLVERFHAQTKFARRMAKLDGDAANGWEDLIVQAEKAFGPYLSGTKFEGIEDALRVAHQIAGLRHVQSLVFDPQPRFLANLPEQFASALGAELIKIPLDTAPAEDAAKAQVGV